MTAAKQPLIREHLRAPVAGRLTMALPFYRGYSGRLIHRVRSGLLHKLGEEHHISLHFWCGNGGFIDSRRQRGRTGGGELFAEPPENAIHCASCEGKATGAGLNGARVIYGRQVLFQPRI